MLPVEELNRHIRRGAAGNHIGFHTSIPLQSMMFRCFRIKVPFGFVSSYYSAFLPSLYIQADGCLPLVSAFVEYFSAILLWVELSKRQISCHFFSCTKEYFVGYVNISFPDNKIVPVGALDIFISAALMCMKPLRGNAPFSFYLKSIFSSAGHSTVSRVAFYLANFELIILSFCIILVKKRISMG